MVKANVAELASGTDSLSVNLNAVTTPATTAQATTTVSAPFPGTEAINTQMSSVEPNAFQKSLANAPAPEPSLFDKGIGKIKDLASSAYEGVTGGDFIGDVAKGVTTGAIMGALQEEPEDVGGYGRMPGAPAMEAAQGNYVQAVAPSAMAATGMTRPLSFQELAKQTLYGTGSPNYLSQFYQPLATPTTQGMG